MAASAGLAYGRSYAPQALVAELMRIAPQIHGAAVAASRDPESAARVTERVLCEAARRHATGLDVAGLESEARLVIEPINFEEPPDALPKRLEAGLDAALDQGLTGLWSSHSPVGPGADAFELAIAIERAWEERFDGRPVITLCPYVVEGLDAADAVDRFTAVSELHEEGVMVPSHRGLQTFKRA